MRAGSLRILVAAAPGVGCVEALRLVERLFGGVEGCVMMARVPGRFGGLEPPEDALLVLVVRGEELRPCREGFCAASRVTTVVVEAG